MISIKRISYYVGLFILGFLLSYLITGCKKADNVAVEGGNNIHFTHAGRLFVCNPNVTIQQIADDSNLGLEAFVCVTEKK